jgi:hypothetical protein
VNLATRKRLFNLCDPREPLAPDDPRNVDVDTLDGSVRGRSSVDALATPIELAVRPVTLLFTGQPGSGVTTELRRLAARLGHKTGANLLAVRIDAAEVLDLHSALDVPDVLFALLEQTDAAVAGAEGKPVIAGALRRFQKWFADFSVEASGAEDRLPVSTILRTKPHARAAFRARVAAELSQFLAEVRSELILLDGRAKRQGHVGLVVVFDGLDRLRGTSATWKDVLTSAEDVFDRNFSHLELPVHVVYTVPSALVFRLKTPVHFLPQIALFDRGGQSSAAGFEAGRQLVRRRVSDANLTDLFGSQADAWIDQLLAQSGGNPGAIVRLLQNVVAEDPLDEQLFERVLSMGGDEYRRMVPAGAYPWLARVHVEKTLPSQGEEHRESAEQMLSNGALLRYQDDAAWFDVHPAVLRIPGIEEAIQHLRGRP